MTTMHWTRALLVLCLIAVLCKNSFAQSQSAFPSLWYPRSVHAGASGEEGVVSRDPMDAMQYNPANLVRVDGVALSVFDNPWKITAGWFNTGMPLTSWRAAMSLGSRGSAGLEYTNWNLGEFYQTGPEGPGAAQKFEMYERSVAGTYAISLGESFAVGGQVRYAWHSMPPGQDKISHVLFGAGLSYEPDLSSQRRLHMGLSFANFGTRIEYPLSSEVDPRTPESLRAINADPPPAQMHLGIRGAAIAQEFFDVDLAVGAMKPFDKRDGPPGFAGHSAFSGLFSDWDDFPNDMTGSVGLGFVWHPISLGAGVSFIQEMDLGFFSTGPAEGLNSFLTHGARIGLEAHGVCLLVGYAGRWHNYRRDSYLSWVFPWETFQLDIRSNLSLLERTETGSAPAIPRNVILSGGYSYGLVMGKMKETMISGGQRWNPNRSIAFSNTTYWSLEADYYINESAALLSSLAYARMTQTFRWTWNGVGLGATVMDHSIETFSLESGFRYHPFEAFRPLFVQASLGIIRMNPVEDSMPRYAYQTFDRLVIGSLVPIADSGIVLIPRVGLRTLFAPEQTNAQRLGGYNQAEVGVNLGYQF